MAYTKDQLVDLFTKANLGKAPDAATTLTLDAFAQQTQTGGITDATALTNTLKLLNSTTAVAISTYQFFNGYAPSQAGLDYLVDSTTNTNDLNDAYYAPFAQENRFISMAINQGAEGAGKAAFATNYTGVSITQTIATAYDKIIGNAVATAAGVDVAAANAYFGRAENLAYLNAFVKANTAFTTAADIDLAVKAALIGQILSAAASSGIGGYATATKAMLTDLSDGTLATDNAAGVNLFTAYPAAPVAPLTISLTKNVDSLTGSAGNDLFVADASVDAVSSAADTVSGGAGTDTFRLFVSDTNATVLPGTMTSIEAIEIKESGTYIAAQDISISSLSSVTSILLEGGVTDADTTANARFTLTVAAGQAVTLSGITDGLAADTANEEGELEIASAAAVDTIALTVNAVGASASDLDIDIAGSGVKTLNVTATGGTSVVGLINSGAALETLNIAGDKLFNASTDAVTTLKTINASTSTGGASVNITGSTLDVTITGSAAADTFIIGADLDTNDKIDGGAGTDTVVVSDAALNSSTSNVGKGINALTNIEVISSAVTAADGVQIDATKFTTINSFGVGAAGALAPADNAANADGDVAVTFQFAAGDTLVVGAAITGGTSGAGESSGGDGINASAVINSGSDVLNLRFAAASIVTGGASQTNAAGVKVSGDGLDASTVETINIATASATADISFVAGTAAAGDTAGASVSVGANATITITGAGDVNLGTIKDQGVAVDDLTINGSAMTGKLTVTTAAGNDVISGGSKADDITAGTGTNTITLGAGSDNFIVTKGAAIGATDVITDFQAGASGDILKGLSATYDALTSAEQTTVNNAASLTDAVNAALTGATDSNWTAFTYSGKTYAVYDTNDAFDTTNGYLVELTGVTVANLDANNFAT